MWAHSPACLGYHLELSWYEGVLSSCLGLILLFCILLLFGPKMWLFFDWVETVYLLYFWISTCSWLCVLARNFLMINASTNFIIYVFASLRFRQELKRWSHHNFPDWKMQKNKKIILKEVPRRECLKNQNGKN